MRIELGVDYTKAIQQLEEVAKKFREVEAAIKSANAEAKRPIGRSSGNTSCRPSGASSGGAAKAAASASSGGAAKLTSQKPGPMGGSLGMQKLIKQSPQYKISQAQALLGQAQQSGDPGLIGLAQGNLAKLMSQKPGPMGGSLGMQKLIKQSPQYKISQAYALLGQAHQSGDPGLINLAQGNLAKLTSQKPAPMGGSLGSLISSTGSGGRGAMPFVGRALNNVSKITGTADAVGLASMAAPIIAVGVAVKSLGEAAVKAKDRLASFAATRANIGGSPGQTAAALGISRALGLGDNAAAQLQGAFSTGPGASAAAAAGINIIGGPYGDNNYAAKLQKAAAYVKNSKSYDQARRKAEAFGMPELANSYFLTNAQISKVGKAPGEGAQRAAIQFNQALAELQNTFTEMAPILIPIMREIEGGLRLVGLAFKFIGDHSDGLQAVINFLDPLAALVAKLMAGDPSGGKDNLGNKLDRASSSIDSNTRAVDSNTRSRYGGDARVDAALPPGIRGQNFDTANRVRLDALG